MSQEFNKTLGRKIYILRKMKGYSREEFAFLTSISPRFLYNVENGLVGISAEKLAKISVALNVSCDFLVELEKDTQALCKKIDELNV